MRMLQTVGQSVAYYQFTLFKSNFLFGFLVFGMYKVWCYALCVQYTELSCWCPLNMTVCFSSCLEISSMPGIVCFVWRTCREVGWLSPTLRGQSNLCNTWYADDSLYGVSSIRWWYSTTPICSVEIHLRHESFLILFVSRCVGCCRKVCSLASFGASIFARCTYGGDFSQILTLLATFYTYEANLVIPTTDMDTFFYA